MLKEFDINSNAMPSKSTATQTETADRLKAIQLRLKELKSHDMGTNQVVNCELSHKKGFKDEASTICIGPNQTRVDGAVLARINWDCHSLATRALLDAVFDKQTLATRNLSGTKLDSRGRKRCLDYVLDPLKVSDIVRLVRLKCKVSEPAIRKIIAIKCADTAHTKRFKNL